jgi:predicted metal-dependent peptidase
MSDQGTSIDTPQIITASDEDIKNFRLDPYLLNLMWDEPFYSAILRRVTKIRTSSIPTAGVAATNGNLKMWWNPEFVAGLPTAHVKGLLKHEAWHIILGHIFDRRKEPHLKWNFATDWSINGHIPVEELPECGLYPGRPYKDLTDEQRSNMSDQQVADYQTMSDFQAKLPVGKSAEWYFSALNQDQDVSEAMDRQEKGEAGDGQPGEAGEPGDGPGMPGNMDSHAGWDEMSDEDREITKGKVKKALGDAVKEADSKGKGWGSVGAEGRKTIREMISNEIPWQSVLKKFCGMTRRANRSTNVKRLNRKYPGIHPGAQKGYTSSIAVYVDQSGSVDDTSLSLLFGELKSLAKHTEFVIYNFDTMVDEKSERAWRKGKTPGIGRTRCGGTCFKAPSVHANKNRKRFDGYLILTDGEAPDPGPTKLKRGWVIIPDSKLYFDSSKRDFVINMKSKKAA